MQYITYVGTATAALNPVLYIEMYCTLAVNCNSNTFGSVIKAFKKPNEPRTIRQLVLGPRLICFAAAGRRKLVP